MKAKLLLDFISVGWAFHDCLAVEATQGTTLKCVLAVQNLLVFEQIWDRRWQPCLRCWLPACDQGSFSIECNCSEPPASPLNTYHRAEMAENVSIMGPLKCHCLSLQRGAFALMELLRPILDAKILLMVIFRQTPGSRLTFSVSLNSTCRVWAYFLLLLGLLVLQAQSWWHSMKMNGTNSMLFKQVHSGGDWWIQEGQKWLRLMWTGTYS